VASARLPKCPEREPSVTCTRQPRRSHSIMWSGLASGVSQKRPLRVTSKPATLVTTESDDLKPANGSKPATSVTNGFLLANGPPGQVGRQSSGLSEAFRELIALELSRGRNATGIWQDLVDTHGFTGGYQSVKRFVRKLRGSLSPDARVIIETRLGEEAQVDYGTGPMVRDSDTGKYVAQGSSC